MIFQEEEPRKYRCSSCGAIDWIRLSRGCRTCESKELELFQESYSSFRKLIFDFSCDMAGICLYRYKVDYDTISMSYADRLCLDIPFVRPYNALYNGCVHSLTEILQDFYTGSISAKEALNAFSVLLNGIKESSTSAYRLVSEGISQWFSSQGSLVAAHDSKPHTLTCRYTNLASHILNNDSIQQRDIDLDPIVLSTLGEAIPAFVEKAGGKMELTTAFGSGRVFSHPYQICHINLTEYAFNKLMKIIRKIPVVVWLCQMEVSGEVEAMAETVRKVLLFISNLREGSCEFCIVNAVVSFKKRTDRYPSLQDIVENLNESVITHEKCRCLEPHHNICSVKREAVAQLMSLQEKSIMKNVSKNEWWVNL